MTGLDHPGLAPLWAAVAGRLQRNGLRPTGTLRLEGLGRDERHALAGLLGRPVARERVTVDLADLDGRLRTGGAAGLVAVTERICGPLVDRSGRRRERAEAAARVWAAGRDELDRAGLASGHWVEAWLEDVRRTGSLGRVPPERAERALRMAVRCVAALPSITGGPRCGRTELASLVTGSAHGLDDGRLVAAVALRALAAMVGTDYPVTASGRRELWRAAGVVTDEVSTTVLTAGLRTGRGSWLDDRTDAGWESHLSGRDLRRFEIRPPGNGVVYVCENPRVLEAAIDAATAAAIVCTMGNPTVVVNSLVQRLAAGGATDLRYHGDFDWPGIAIANSMIGTYGCRPWRFETADYLDALARFAAMVGELPELGPAATTACWDERLTGEMARADRAVHEELVLEELLNDLRGNSEIVGSFSGAT